MHYGPLTAITGGIAVASNDALHLRITPEGVTHHRGATVISETIPWSDIIGIEVNLPSSWFPWPGALATTGYALVTLLSGQVEDVHSEESSITVSLADDKHLRASPSITQSEGTGNGRSPTLESCSTGSLPSRSSEASWRTRSKSSTDTRTQPAGAHDSPPSRGHHTQDAFGSMLISRDQHPPTKVLTKVLSNL